MNLRQLLLALTSVGALAISAPASAMVLDFSYTGPADSHTFGFGTLDTASSTSPSAVTSISGTETFMGSTDTITGLSTYASADNLVYFPTAPYVDFSGISFTTAHSGDFNLYYDGSNNWILSQVQNPGGYPDGQNPINLQVSMTAAVPEPATWALMLLGFLGVGFLGYRKSLTAGTSSFRLA